jgi:hypothetical protein
MKDMVQDKERLNMKLYISEENLNELVINTLKQGYTMEQVHEILDKLNVTTNIKEVE